MIRTAIVDHVIDLSALLAEAADVESGATILFVGTVRDVNDGRRVTGIEYSAYRPMAERELASIALEAAERFATNAIVVEHRLGALALGDASVAIVVAHARRDRAYDASRYVIEQLKLRVPVWKLEHYVDGSRGWVNAGTAGRVEDQSSGGESVQRAAAQRVAAQRLPAQHAAARHE
jgi:molybdopterin synthase catalytic subunit